VNFTSGPFYPSVSTRADLDLIKTSCENKVVLKYYNLVLEPRSQSEYTQGLNKSCSSRTLTSLFGLSVARAVFKPV